MIQINLLNSNEIMNVENICLNKININLFQIDIPNYLSYIENVFKAKIYLNKKHIFI